MGMYRITTGLIKGIFSLLFPCIFFSLCYSQKKDTTRLYFNHTATGMYNKTNELSSYLANNNVKFNIISKSIVINTTNSWVYGEQTSGLTNNDFFSGADFNLYKTIQHFYYWGLVAYDKSYSLKINNRIQTGAGVGYSFVDRPNLSFVVSDGIIYESTNLYGSEIYDSLRYETVRNSLRIKFKIMMFKKRIVLDGTDFWQPSFESFEDYIIKSNTNLSVKIKDWLSLTMSVNYNKLNLTRRENLLSTLGFTFERSF